MKTILLLAALTACVWGKSEYGMLRQLEHDNQSILSELDIITRRLARIEADLPSPSHPILTFEVRLDTVWPERVGDSATFVYSLEDLDINWNLYVIQTTPDAVRRFGVCRIEATQP